MHGHQHSRCFTLGGWFLGLHFSSHVSRTQVHGASVKLNMAVVVGSSTLKFTLIFALIFALQFHLTLLLGNFHHDNDALADRLHRSFSS